MGSNRTKLVLGMVGAGAVLAMGGLSVTVSDDDPAPQAPVVLADNAETTVRGPETSFAKPPITTAPFTIPTGEPQ